MSFTDVPNVSNCFEKSSCMPLSTVINVIKKTQNITFCFNNYFDKTQRTSVTNYFNQLLYKYSVLTT